MYPVIVFDRDENRVDLFRSWLDQQWRVHNDPLVSRAFYYTRNDSHGIYAGEAELKTFGQSIIADSDLLLIVTAGQITLKLTQGVELQAITGKSLVIPRGSEFTWSNATGTRVWFVAYQPAVNAGITGHNPFLVDEDAPLTQVDGPATELLTTPSPVVHRDIAYQSADQKFSVGIWQATAYQRRLAGFGDYELMYPIAGEINITNTLGESTTFGPHQGFIVNRGVSNAWHSDGQVKKIYSKISV